jgi:transposase
MNRITIYVGLDYHQSGVQVCAMDKNGRVLVNKRCPNDWKAIMDRVGRTGCTIRVAIESCSGAANLAEELVAHAGWSVDLAHPGYVSRMKQSPDKSDYSDARMLADLVRVGYLPRVWLAPEPIRELRLLVRYRQQIINDRRNVKLRIGAVLREQRIRFDLARPWTKMWMGWLRETDDLSRYGRWVIDRHLNRLAYLEQELSETEAGLAEATKGDPLINRLMSLPGVGPATAWMLRAEIGRFDRFQTGKQLSRFCGLSPRNASSGERQADSGLIRAANRQLRAMLIQAGHRLIRHDRRWSELGARLMEAGKPRTVAVAAVANRWIRWLFHEMQTPAAA